MLRAMGLGTQRAHFLGIISRIRQISMPAGHQDNHEQSSTVADLYCAELCKALVCSCLQQATVMLLLNRARKQMQACNDH